MGKRNFRDFTEEELKIINENNGKISMKELGTTLNINAGNLCSAMIQKNIKWNSKRAERITPIADKLVMNKKRNEKGELLLTDELMKSWY